MYDPKGTDLTLEMLQELLDLALAIDPLSGEAYTSLAMLKDDSEDLEEAGRLYQKAIDLSPNYYRAYHWYGAHLWERGRGEESLAAYQKALELAPSEFVIRVPMSRLLMSLGRGDEALALLKEGVREYPQYVGFYFAIGDWYENHGALGEALRWARAGRVVAPDHRGVGRLLCHVQAKLHEFEAAEQCFDWLKSEFGVFYPDHNVDLAIGRSDFNEARRRLNAYYSSPMFPRMRR